MASHSSGFDGRNDLGSRAQTSSKSGVFRHLEREGSWEIGPGASRERIHGTFRGRARGGSWDGKQGRSRDKYHGESYNGTQKEPSKRGQGESWNKPGSTVSRENGNTGNRHHPSTKFHSIQSLQRIMEKPPDELVLYMTNERWIPATESLLNQKVMKDDMIVQLLKVLAHACDSETAHARLTNLLSRLPTSMYFSYHLSNYIIRWADSIQFPSEEREKELICMNKIFSELLNKQPSCYPHLPLAQLSYTTKILADKAMLCNEAIESDVEDLMTLKNEMAEKVKKEVEEMGKNPKRQKRINEAALRDAEAPPDDFRALSITPTIQDMHTRGAVFLRRNKISGRYNDNEHYLDVQFRLLREDFIRPLREGIQQLLERMETANFKFLQDIRVYSGVRILYPIFTIKGLTHKIGFDVSKLKRVRWENSKRLIYGSLLCLSRDNFETFLLATVETREEEQLKQGMLEVRFTDLSPRIDLGRVEYQMVETTAYFESYRHVLEGLKEIDPENLPFQRYIVECDNDIQPPEYLRNRMREEVTYDLLPIMTGKAKRNVCLLRKIQSQDESKNREQIQIQGQDENQDYSIDNLQSQDQDQDQDQVQCQDQYEDQTQEQRREYIRKKSGKSVRILDMDSWPSAEDLELDDSQLKAVQLALTKEFAIIQGPPGTGKTYIGLKVVKVLLHNKEQWNRGTEKVVLPDAGQQVANNMPVRPILVVCYTNHALDQFLEGILEFHKKGIIRIGGRCQSEMLKSFTLQEIKHQMRKEKTVPDDIWFAIQEANKKLKLSSNELKSATLNLQICKENIIHEEELQEKGIMSQEQFESMICPFKNPYSNKRNALTIYSAMLYWLNLVPDPSTMENKPGPNAKLVAQFSFDIASNLTNRVNPSHKAVANRVKFMPGLHGKRDSSLELDGSRNSYIMIPNHEMNFLDTRWSMTILMYVYPMSGRGGPILSFYHPQTGFIGIQITQKGVQKGKGVISVSFNSRDGALFEPLNTAVLNMKQWNFIAASYDHHTGFMRLWHDGKLVQERQYPRMEIASHFPVFIGSLNLPTRRQSCFEGRVCFLEIYAEALRNEQIMAIAGIREEDLLTEDQKQDTDVLMEAKAIEKQRRLDDEQSFGMNPNEKEPQVETLKIADQFDKQAGSQARFKLNFTNPQKLWIKEAIKKELSNRDMMQIPEGRSVKNVWKLTIRDRWRLYRRWITHLSSRYKNAVTRHQNDFEERAQELKEVHNLEDLKILEEATVIGMTTTGAAKYRHLIQKIKPRITIVEEAAEVLESHIVTSLSPGCQHLILIGDHQQLRPNANVYKLATDYNLDVSLFERMVHNGMKIERLRAQHRMRPEIARLIKPIYHDLENHESVLKYENIKGVNSNIFFIEHNELEELIEEGMSRTNIHEAKYLAALCRYFILQGYQRQKITILTMYTGQLIQLKKEMPKEFFQGVRICAVDNFQGEENDIILLSLVRSNEDGKIGFLRISNRVCVALSRAKKGFYCIGNLELMCEQKGSLWDKIIDDMRNEGKVGPYLTLMCQNHPKTIIHASKPNDFLKAPQGGCMEPCKARLDCGHVCTLLCHPADPEHTEYKCKEKCLKSCDRGHKCKQLCYEKCNPCPVLVSKKIPSCGHDQKVPCSMDPKDFDCRAPCERFCDSGHKCKQLCYEECNPCRVLVPKKIPSCGHDQKVPCSMDPKDFNCKAPCERSCDNGHQCEKLCYKKCGPCPFVMQKKISSCGHDQEVPCHMKPKDFNCQAPCERTCDQGHNDCKMLCHQDCNPCNVFILKKIPSCGHDQKVPCHMDPQDFKCQARCPKNLPCNHPCQNKCFEPCITKCRQETTKQLLCGHEKEVQCCMNPKDATCSAVCDALLKCNHSCKGNCSQCLRGRLHKPCQGKCDRTLFCGHSCQDKCANNCPPCPKNCENKCTHKTCKKKCGEPCIPCRKPCNWKCQHFKCTKLCSEPCDRPRCDKPCKKKPFKKCRHRCIGMCGEPCPKKCRECDKEEVTQHLFGDEHNPNARFVEVQPCGHVIEVRAMDNWVDERTSDTSNLGIIRCPRCKAPIRTCARYGNIIKTTLIDLEKIKAKTFLGRKELIRHSVQLKQIISNHLHAEFPEEAKHIKETLERKDIKSDQLSCCEKQIYVMNCLSKLCIGRKQKGRKELPKTSSTHGEVIKSIKDDVSSLVSRVMIKGRQHFSDQEMDEINNEIKRVFLMYLYEFRRRTSRHEDGTPSSLDLGALKQALESGTPIDEATHKLHIKELTKLQTLLDVPLSEDPLKIQSENELIKVIYLTQDHWSKCPEGHVYYINECDAVVSEEGFCTECESIKSKVVESSSR